MSEKEDIKSFWEDRNKQKDFLWRKDLTNLNITLVRSIIRKNDKVLDLGTGDGSIPLGISDIASSIVAVDFVDRAKSLNRPNIKVLISNIEDLQLEEKFDVITILGVMNFFLEPASIYKKCHQWLNPNGILFVKHQCGKSIDKTVNGYSEDLKFNYVAYYRTAKNEVKFMEESGFSVDYFDPYNNNNWPDTEYIAFSAKKL